eukprot:scaffold5354_cov67-Isochrysis_galbana.AAC.1
MPLPPVPLTARPFAPAVPQIADHDALTSLSVPVLASVGGNFKVRHTQPPLLPTLPACRVCA